MKRLSLRTQPQQEARLRQRVGSGLRYPFTLEGESGELRLTLTDENALRPATTLAIGCDSGLLHIADAAAVCSLLSTCPLLPDPGENAGWYWPLFSQHLGDALRTLFGTLTPPQNVSPEPESLWLSISVTLGEARADSQLCASVPTLLALLNRPGWRRLTTTEPDSLPLTLPLCMGALSLPLSQLQTLRPDDVIFPARAHFSPCGRGELRIAQLSLTGELECDAGLPVRFFITDLETTYVNLTPDDYAMDDLPQPDETQVDALQNAASPFDSLPLALTLRCGHLRLTLGELNRLGKGSTLMVDHVVPGEALLCHGEFPLAKGELVDVEGRLGLQITHMLPGVASLLDSNR